MKKALTAIAALTLAGCQTVGKVTVQGVDLARERPLAVSAALIGGGVLIAHYVNEQDADTIEKPQCKTFTSAPVPKGGTPVCAIPLDVYTGN